MAAGTRLVTQGEKATAAYFILDGEAAAGIPDAEGGYRGLSTMGAGDFFGEIAALTGSPRTADVVTTRDSTLMEVPADALRAVMEVPEVSKLLLSTLTERLLRSNQPDLPRLASMDQAALRDLRTKAPTVEALPKAYDASASVDPSAPGHRAHRVHTDDDRRAGIQAQLVAHVAPGEQLRHEAALGQGQADEQQVVAHAHGADIVIPAVDPEAAAELVEGDPRAALDEPAQLGDGARRARDLRAVATLSVAAGVDRQTGGRGRGRRGGAGGAGDGRWWLADPGAARA